MASPARSNHWRTRKDPLIDVWAQELVPLLESKFVVSPALLPATLFDYLCDNYPGRYDNKILRTLQRRIKSWKAKYGPAKDVMFRQIKVPGRLGLSDFTGLKDATITLTQGAAEAWLKLHFLPPIRSTSEPD